MSVMDQIRELDKQKDQLLAGAKQEAIDLANKAISALNELGFDYKLVQGGTSATPTRSGTRRTGIRDQVLKIIQTNPSGVNRRQLIDALNAKGDKSAEQSISNATAALKKQGAISAQGGVYKSV